MSLLVYYSSKTEPQKLVDQPFVLVLPTYAGGDGRGAVPKAVVHFLNEESNRQLLRGVITSGNRNFGWTYGLAGLVIAQQCNVPQLYRFDLRGTPQDISGLVDKELVNVLADIDWEVRKLKSPT